MLKIKNGGLGQYGAEPFEQQQFGKASIEGVEIIINISTSVKSSNLNHGRLKSSIQPDPVQSWYYAIRTETNVE